MQPNGDEHTESLEENWRILQETVLDHMVFLHNALYGSMDLIQNVCRSKIWCGYIYIYYCLESYIYIYYVFLIITCNVLHKICLEAL